MDILRAELKDLEDLVPLFDLYRQFYKAESDWPAVKEFLKQRFEKMDSIIFLAREKGVLVGFTQLYPTFSSVSLASLWILNDLYVRENFRRLEVAWALLGAAQDFAKASGARGLTLKMLKDNSGAQKLYEKRGWIRDEKFFNYNFIF